MSAIDDLFEVRDAFDRWEKEWRSWRKALDDDSATLAFTECRAVAAMKALDYLIEQATEARVGFVKRGWGKP